VDSRYSDCNTLLLNDIFHNKHLVRNIPGKWERYQSVALHCAEPGRAGARYKNQSNSLKLI
jgi:hypothetical protein